MTKTAHGIALVASVMALCAEACVVRIPIRAGSAPSSRATDPAWVLGESWAHVRGPATAPVRVVIFTDLECPFCARLEGTLAEIEARYVGRVRWVFRHRVLAFHKNARSAALSAEAAGQQGKFWPYARALMLGGVTAGRRPPLDEARQMAVAQELGLDLVRFRADRQDLAPNARIDADDRAALALGVTGTPTMFVNGRKVVGARPAAEISLVLDEELKRAETLAKSGAPPSRVADTATVLNRTFPWERVSSGPRGITPLPGQPARRPMPQLAPAPVEQTGPAQPGDPVQDHTVYRVPVTATAPRWGAEGAPLTFVVFHESLSKPSGQVWGTLRTLAQRHPGKVRFVYRNFDTGQLRHANLLGEAVYAAAAQGKWLELLEAVSKSTDGFDPADLKRIAEEVGLDPVRFEHAQREHVYGFEVAADTALARSLGVRAAPTVFLNGRRIVGTRSLEVFEAILRQELERADKLLKDGVPPAQLYDTLVEHGRSAPQA